MSKIRRKAKLFLIDWLKTLLNKEEQDKINIKNIFSLLPNQTHYWQGTTLRLQPWSYKWIVKKLKKNPHWTMEDLNKSLELDQKNMRLEGNKVW